MYRYEKDMGKTYLVFWYEECYGQFEMSMLEDNCIEGLVKFEKWYINGNCEYRYDITNKNKLSAFTEYKRLTFENVKQIFKALFRTVIYLKEFLMEPGSLMLNAEFIYISDSRVEFIFNYKESTNFTDSVSELIKFMLDKLDYSDNRAVELVYKMFDYVSCQNEKTRRLEEVFETCVKEASKEDINECRILKSDGAVTESYVSEFYAEKQIDNSINNQTEVLNNAEAPDEEFSAIKPSENNNEKLMRLRMIGSKISVMIIVISIICMLFKILS